MEDSRAAFVLRQQHPATEWCQKCIQAEKSRWLNSHASAIKRSLTTLKIFHIFLSCLDKWLIIAKIKIFITDFYIGPTLIKIYVVNSTHWDNSQFFLYIISDVVNYVRVFPLVLWELCSWFCCCSLKLIHNN